MAYGWAHTVGHTEGHTECHTEGKQGHTESHTPRCTYVIRNLVIRHVRGPISVIRQVIPLESLMAKNVIALSYVGMTPPMTNKKIVKRKSYRRMTML